MRDVTPGSGSHRDAAADGLYTQNDCGPSRGSKQWRFRSAERFLHCEAIEILTGLKRLRHKTQDAKKQRGTLNRDQRRGRGGRGLVMITALAALPSEKQKPRTAAETFTVTLCFTESI